MRFFLAASISFAALLACNREFKLANDTRPAGYAMGERITLRFYLSGNGQFPDSIKVGILEKKTGYEYSAWAVIDSCNSFCRYQCLWDGRKPDGSWPAGGRYLVFATADVGRVVHSDTVLIGLTD